MRGCLAVLVMGLVVLVLLALVAVPALASVVVRQGVVAAGLDASDLTVEVTADPPTDLLALHADRIEIAGTDATWDEHEVGRIHLVLDDVDLASREADAVRGTLDDVRATTGSGELRLPIDRIELAGPSGSIRADVSIAATAAETYIAGRLRETAGVQPTSVRLAPADRLAVEVGGTVVEGRLVVEPDGALVLASDVPTLSSVVLLAPGALPVRLTGVVVRPGELALTGVLETDLAP